MEELHFEYSSSVERPRVFNDMITLRSGDHMIKLAMSHAIAQSTKLSFFEEKMSQTMLDAQHVPKHLALTGKLGMSRKEIVKILGRLFKSRVDVNLCELSHHTSISSSNKSQHQISSTSPISSGIRNPLSTPSTSPSGSISRSDHASKSSTSAAESSSSLPKSSLIPLQTPK